MSELSVSVCTYEPFDDIELHLTQHRVDFGLIELHLTQRVDFGLGLIELQLTQ